jgi:hypothetical protein
VGSWSCAATYALDEVQVSRDSQICQRRRNCRRNIWLVVLPSQRTDASSRAATRIAGSRSRDDEVSSIGSYCAGSLLTATALLLTVWKLCVYRHPKFTHRECPSRGRAYNKDSNGWAFKRSLQRVKHMAFNASCVLQTRTFPRRGKPVPCPQILTHITFLQKLWAVPSSLLPPRTVQSYKFAQYRTGHRPY